MSKSRAAQIIESCKGIEVKMNNEELEEGKKNKTIVRFERSFNRPSEYLLYVLAYVALDFLNSENRKTKYKVLRDKFDRKLKGME